VLALSETRHASTESTYYPYRAAITLLGTLIAFPDLSPPSFPACCRPVPGPVPAAGHCSSNRSARSNLRLDRTVLSAPRWRSPR